jgi:hypothetical protein
VETGFPSGQTRSVCPEIMLKQRELGLSLFTEKMAGIDLPFGLTT